MFSVNITRRLFFLSFTVRSGSLEESLQTTNLVGELWGSDPGNRTGVYRVKTAKGVRMVEWNATSKAVFTCPRESIGIGSRVRMELSYRGDSADGQTPYTIHKIEYLSAPSVQWRSVAAAIQRLLGYFHQDDANACQRSPEAFGLSRLSSGELSLLFRLYANRIPGHRTPASGLGGWAVAEAAGGRIEAIHSGLAHWNGVTALRIQMRVFDEHARIVKVLQSDHDSYFALLRPPTSPKAQK